MITWHVSITFEAPRGAVITDDTVSNIHEARPDFSTVSSLPGNRLEFTVDADSHSSEHLYAVVYRHAADATTDELGYPVEFIRGEVVRHDHWLEQIDPNGEIQAWAEQDFSKLPLPSAEEQQRLLAEFDNPAGEIRQSMKEIPTPTEFFFYDVDVPVLDTQGLVADGLGGLAMEWIEDDAGRSLLVLGNDKLIVQGYVEAESREAATRHAMAVANDLFRNQLGEQLALPPARVRDPQEHLAFLNNGLVPEYQLPHIPLHQAMELGAAAHMRAIEPTPTEAQLYRAQLPTDNQ